MSACVCGHEPDQHAETADGRQACLAYVTGRQATARRRTGDGVPAARMPGGLRAASWAGPRLLCGCIDFAAMAVPA